MLTSCQSSEIFPNSFGEISQLDVPGRVCLTVGNLLCGSAVTHSSVHVTTLVSKRGRTKHSTNRFPFRIWHRLDAFQLAFAAVSFPGIPNQFLR
jgi:hypothetical protein